MLLVWGGTLLAYKGDPYMTAPGDDGDCFLGTCFILILDISSDAQFAAQSLLKVAIDSFNEGYYKMIPSNLTSRT